MKKLIIILVALACISTLGVSKAEANLDSLYVENTVTPMVLPLSSQPGKFKVTFFGVLVTPVFEGYTFPLPSSWNGEQQLMDMDCEGCTFEIIAENSSGPLVSSGSTVSFSVTSDGIFGGRWEPLSQSDATLDLTFKVRYTGIYGLYGPFELDSEEFAICDIAGATSHIDICKPVVEDPDPSTLCGDGILASTEECEDGNTISGDGCSDICELETVILCDDNDQDGICNTDDLDNDNDGWSDIEEDDCITDPLDPNDQPADSDGDGICDILDDDPSSSTIADDDSVVDADSNATEFGGGSCSLNPSATADFGMLFFLTLICLTTPIAVTLHLRKKR